MTSKQLFGVGLAAVALIMLVSVVATSYAQPLLDAASQPKFVNSLPIPARIDAKNGGRFNMEMREVTQYLGLVDGSNNSLPTTVWGYGWEDDGEFLLGPSYPGPTC